MTNFSVESVTTTLSATRSTPLRNVVVGVSATAAAAGPSWNDPGYRYRVRNLSLRVEGEPQTHHEQTQAFHSNLPGPLTVRLG